MVAQVGSVPIYAGDTEHFPAYAILTGAGAPRDLNAEGWINWACQWRPTDSATEAIELSVDTTNTDSGIIQISASAEQTRQMGGDGVWDVQAQDSTGRVKTWFRGKTKWTRDVTRNG